MSAVRCLTKLLMDVKNRIMIKHDFCMGRVGTKLTSGRCLTQWNPRGAKELSKSCANELKAPLDGALHRPVGSDKDMECAVEYLDVKVLHILLIYESFFRQIYKLWFISHNQLKVRNRLEWLRPKGDA